MGLAAASAILLLLGLSGLALNPVDWLQVGAFTVMAVVGAALLERRFLVAVTPTMLRAGAERIPIAAIIDVSVETDADSPVALHRVLVNHARGSTILRGSTELRWDAADRTRATLARLIDERRGASGRA